MKRFFTLFTGCVALAVLLLSNARGRGEASGNDATGSPLSIETCSNCHNGGNFETETMVLLTDMNGDSVSEVMAGETYQLKLNIATVNNPGGYGFQLTVLDSTQAAAGTFGDAPSDTKILTLGEDIEYWEHATRLADSAWTISWTASESAQGPITIYAIGNAVNGNGAAFDDSDLANTTSLALPQAMTSSTRNLVNEIGLITYPTITQDKLTVTHDLSQKDLEYSIIDMSGRVTRTGRMTGSVIEVNDLARGLYFFRLKTTEGFATVKFLKQ